MTNEPSNVAHRSGVAVSSQDHARFSEWNATERAFPTECIQELFEKQVDERPNSIAVVFNKEQLTYADLNARANRLARKLQSTGVGPGELIGILVDHSLEMVIGIMGVLKAGCAYVPIDPRYPAERRDYLFQDSRCRVLLTQTRYLSGLRFGGTILALDDADCYRGESGNLPKLAKPTDLAYVIYTSGSTGQPKGVMIEHRSLVNYIAWAERSYLAETQCFALCTSLSFDLTVTSIFAPLISGRKIKIFANEAASVSKVISDGEVDVVKLTPSHLQLVQQIDCSRSAVRVFIVGGEELKTALTRDIHHRFNGKAKIYNEYGPTEATVGCMIEEYRDESTSVSVPIGKPAQNTRLFILDEQGQLVAPGTVGELYIAGVGLARGYWNRPGLTAERFIANPREPAERLYRTGDNARWREDGTMEYFGRIDGQVKIRGFRIELGEIESVLARLPPIAHCAVIAREDQKGDVRLVAYVVSAPGRQIDAAWLKHELSSVLPPHMVPAAFVQLDALPLTPNGKLDRRGLPKPDYVRAILCPPETAEQKKLCEFFSEIFQIQDVGLDDNFFDLGGHSLLAARLVEEVKKRLGYSLSISTLFYAPTIRTLSAILGQGPAPDRGSLVTLQAAGSKPPLFCIHGWGGTVYGYLNLARNFVLERPVYGLQALGLDEQRPQHATIEEMAFHYANEIMSHQPEGFYHLMGHSLGGWIAFQVAREIRKRGGKVLVLALLDTVSRSANLSRWLRATSFAKHLLRRAGFHARKIGRVSPVDRVAYVQKRLKNFWLQVFDPRKKHQPLSARAAVSTGSNGPATHYKDWDYFAAASVGFRPKPYEGSVVLVVPETDDENRSFWGGLVRGRIQVVPVPGDHLSLIDKDHAEGFAKKFREILRQSESSAGE